MNASGRTVSAIVLAAGQGTRMRSDRPKPLHVLAGRPMVGYVLEALAAVAPERIVVVVGHGSDRVVEALSGDVAGVAVEFVEQAEQRGTGDAVGVALAAFGDDPDGDVIVVPGDTPLLEGATLATLLEAHRADEAAATLLTAVVDDPTGYGRVIRSEAGQVAGVVEQRDATEAQQAVREINTSIYCFGRELLASALARVRPDNAQGEWYLTDVVGILDADGHRVGASVVADPDEAQGVNDRVQLAAAEAMLRARINARWMRDGVTMVDPVATYVDPTVTLGRDVTVFPGAVLRGATTVGDGAVVGPHVVLDGVTVGAGAEVGASAVVSDGATVAPGTRIAPLSHVVGGPDAGER